LPHKILAAICLFTLPLVGAMMSLETYYQQLAIDSISMASTPPRFNALPP